MIDRASSGEDAFGIRTERLTRRFGTRLAVDGLTLEVRQGEIVGLLGPNGAGKTTTLRLLAAMLTPSSGMARVAGVDPVAAPDQVHATVGWLTETPGLYARLTAEENLAYFARFYGLADVGTAIRSNLDRMGLLDRRNDRVGTYSRGMKQRLALARALVHRPPVLLLDEPTAGLDPQAARDLRSLVIELSNEQRSILLCTHNLAEAEQLCDRIAVLRTRLVAFGTPAALRQAHSKPAIRLRLAKGDEELIRGLRGEPYVEDIAPDDEGKRLTVRLADARRDRPRLVSRAVALGAEILEVVELEATLEALYMDLMEEER